MNNTNEPFSPAEFVDEINFNDLELLEIVGRGAYGTVQRAVWEGEIVAIKIIDMNSGIKEYQDEVEQLSQVRHKNIIRLFGTSINKHKVYIVMEYADCGSLYNLLHPSDPDEELIPYTLGHVFSWSLQCAEAVEYLHSLQPKVIHRDLKSPNMLLLDSGKVIKICDFGTATQIHTEMTSNKGSAAWMAPEVFEGKHYSERCDVYSFGIVLWEMLSRKKPFDEIGPPAFRILWAVYNGTRPPPLQGVSESLMQLMESCWTKDQSKRPSFSQIVQYFRTAEKFAHGAEIPIFYYYDDDDDDKFQSLRAVESPVWERADDFFPNHELKQKPTTPPDDVTPLQQPFNEYSYPPVCQQSPYTGSSTQNAPYGIFQKSPLNDGMFNADWSLVPQHLMPIKPIQNDETSVQMYDNYNETLKKYIDIQTKIKDFKIQKENLDRQIKEVNIEQKNNAIYLTRYSELDKEKTNLLELHRRLNSMLESEKTRRMLNRSMSHNS